MKNKIYTISAAVVVLVGMSACDKENSFDFKDGEGLLNCESLSVDYVGSNSQVRAGNIDIDNFNVYFVNEKNEMVKEFIYSQMPALVSLPTGSYKIVADYGDNPVQGWDAPYYYGISESSFVIDADKITDNVAPVVCKLNNIKITVNIDDNGLGLIGEDAMVAVSVGDGGQLTYAKGETKTGYFKYAEGSNTITATFSGTVNGEKIEGVSKTYTNAAPGNAYTIDFTVVKPENKDDGSIIIGGGSESGIDIDATITIIDENYQAENPDKPYDTVIEDMISRPTGEPDDEGNL